jgi:GNAT superfamily N-acetyltransferase
MGDLVFRTLTADLAQACEALELAAFPTAEPEDLFSAQVVRAYAEVFPEGFFVCLDGERVVGQAAGIFVDFDFEHPQHTLEEIAGEDQCRNHDPAGAWYYGTDIVVDPEYRRRGIGERLYELRKDVVRRHGKRGIIAGGYMPGFRDHIGEMSADEYLEKVAAGEIYDRTLTFQMENGFEIRGALADYLRDETIGNYAALIVWVAD